ncbi:MAG: SGNH/GDSL hydrolase family protein [Kiritimatiellae bacterium]|nr:SGNH/GDSL hydrolase family protein [Kiritimatiellia bacterium]
MATRIKRGEKILFIGDSITDCGRRGAESPLGNGYVKLFENLLFLREPAKDVCVVNKGISGDTVPGLQSRWTDDVLRQAPNWLAIKIGINDLHRALRNDPSLPATDPKSFRVIYDEILTRTRAQLPRCRILLIDPFYISTETSAASFRAQVLQALPAYLAVVHAMSVKHGALCVRTHELFQKLLRYREADYFCPEPVHPNLCGHLIIAEAVYRALEAAAPARND